MSKRSKARESNRESLPRSKRLTKLDELIQWTAVVLAGIALSVGLAAAQAANGSAHREPRQQPEAIGTVQQVYDGTLFPDIQVQTFRNIDRLFPTRTVRRGTQVYPLPRGESPLKSVEFISAGKKYFLYGYRSFSQLSGFPTRSSSD